MNERAPETKDHRLTGCGVSMEGVGEGDVEEFRESLELRGGDHLREE
jgi:hypothetical protein